MNIEKVGLYLIEKRRIIIQTFIILLSVWFGICIMEKVAYNKWDDLMINIIKTQKEYCEEKSNKEIPDNN